MTAPRSADGEDWVEVMPAAAAAYEARAGRALVRRGPRRGAHPEDNIGAGCFVPRWARVLYVLEGTSAAAEAGVAARTAFAAAWARLPEVPELAAALVALRRLGDLGPSDTRALVAWVVAHFGAAGS